MADHDEKLSKARRTVNKLIEDLLDKAKDQAPQAQINVKQLGVKTVEQLLSEVDETALDEVKSKVSLLLATRELTATLADTVAKVHDMAHLLQVGVVTIAYMASLLEPKPDDSEDERDRLKGFLLDAAQTIEANLIAGNMLCDFHNRVDGARQDGTLPGRQKAQAAEAVESGDFADFMKQLNGGDPFSTKPGTA